MANEVKNTIGELSQVFDNGMTVLITDLTGGIIGGWDEETIRETLALSEIKKISVKNNVLFIAIEYI